MKFRYTIDAFKMSILIISTSPESIFITSHYNCITFSIRLKNSALLMTLPLLIKSTFMLVNFKHFFSHFHIQIIFLRKLVDEKIRVDRNKKSIGYIFYNNIQFFLLKKTGLEAATVQKTCKWLIKKRIQFVVFFCLFNLTS